LMWACRYFSFFSYAVNIQFCHLTLNCVLVLLN
jgi:hypothetical protein